MSDSLSKLRQKKIELRRAMEAKRVEANILAPGAALSLRDNFLGGISISPGSIVASYSVTGSEIDPAALTAALRAKGHAIALPAVAETGAPLAFRLFEAGARLVPGRLGILEPPRDAPACEPDIFLVPLLAFDRRGYRLGYGGGYYDRTLQDCRQRKTILAVGLAFGCQEIAEVPNGAYDVKLDKIVTENEVLVAG